MANRVFWISQAVVLAALAVAGVGCSKSQASAALLTPKDIAGSWAEVRGDAAETGSRVDNTQTTALGANLRQLTINEDGTYTQILSGPDGKQIGKQASAGTWKINRRVIMFESRDNNFDASIKALMGPLSGNCNKRETGYILMISDEAQNMATFKKKGG